MQYPAFGPAQPDSAINFSDFAKYGAWARETRLGNHRLSALRDPKTPGRVPERIGRR
jgi:hypothetical protein